MRSRADVTSQGRAGARQPPKGVRGMRGRKGQGTLEYVILVSVILLAVLFVASSFHAGLEGTNGILDQAKAQTLKTAEKLVVK